MPRNPPVVLRRLALLVALTAIAIAAVPAVAGAAAVGVNVDGLTPQQAVDQASAVGATWVRTFVRWDDTEPAGPGRWNPANVQAMDDLLSLAQPRGDRKSVV